jgi:hypothetical protein
MTGCGIDRTDFRCRGATGPATEDRLFDRRHREKVRSTPTAPGQSATIGIGEIRRAVIGKPGKALCFATHPRLWKGACCCANCIPVLAKER